MSVHLYKQFSRLVKDEAEQILWNQRLVIFMIWEEESDSESVACYDLPCFFLSLCGFNNNKCISNTLNPAMTIHVWGSKHYTWNITTIHNVI